MSISPETVESQMDRERSIRRNMQFPQAAVVGVQSNRLCTLTAWWRSYCFIHIDERMIMKQWVTTAFFCVESVAENTKEDFLND